MTGDGIFGCREGRLGDQLASFRRRPEKDVLRTLGANPFLYYLSPLFGVLLAFFLTGPVVLLAPKPHPGGSVLAQPVWGPVIIVWFAVCLAAVVGFMYLLPRRCRLTIHRAGFIYQGMYRRHVVLFEDIATYEAPPTSSEFLLLLKDSRKMHFGGFRAVFPSAGITCLLETIDANVKRGQSQETTSLRSEMRAKVQRIGLVFGLLLVLFAVLALLLAPGSHAFNVKAFGHSPLGLPCPVFVALLTGVLFCPFVYVLMHLFRLQAVKWPRFSGVYDPGEIRKSWMVVGAGLLYFLALAAAWIVYTEIIGI